MTSEPTIEIRIRKQMPKPVRECDVPEGHAYLFDATSADEVFLSCSDRSRVRLTRGGFGIGSLVKREGCKVIDIGLLDINVSIADMVKRNVPSPAWVKRDEVPRLAICRRKTDGKLYQATSRLNFDYFWNFPSAAVAALTVFDSREEFQVLCTPDQVTVVFEGEQK